MKPKKRKDVLAAEGRRAGEKRGMPVSDDQAGLKNWNRGFCGDRHNCWRCCRHGRRHMHDYAKRAMVRIRCNSMCVRHLDERKQQQQAKTQ